MEVCEVVMWYSVARVPRNAVATMAVRRAMRTDGAASLFEEDSGDLRSDDGLS